REREGGRGEGTVSSFLFEYETPRQVLVRNRRVGIACRLIQLGVLGYIIGWVFIYEKGYQNEDTAIYSVFTKMKGVAYTQISGVEKVWDVSDYAFPDQGGDSFVVMTNFIITFGQTQSKCPELLSPSLLLITPFLPGHMTGKCVNTTHTCEIVTWCPVEDDRQIPNPPCLLAAENFTLFIKNSITFPEFKVDRSNLVESVDASYIKRCLYHPATDPLCPIFKLGDIVRLSGFNFTEVARVGGSIGVLIDWECDLDYSIQNCKPKYKFHGLYGSGTTGQASVGYNFRKANYYVEDKVQKRTLMKVFGLRIEVIVHGLARKFDIIPTLTAIGSGVGIFGVATVVCDLMLLHLLPKRNLYKNMKFKYTEILDGVSVPRQM
uniref:P2X purinoceptor n=1 Tax=Electrophorus electricus TaxID=8005 RepID=A0A4W4EFI0_ELEEL